MKPILVVDDEAIVRESLRDWLVDAGYSVETAETGEEALEKIASQDYAVVILDVRLPGKSGVTVLREAKALKPKLKSIMITAYPTAELAAQAKMLGASHQLTKPVFPEELERLIRETLAKWDDAG